MDKKLDKKLVSKFPYMYSDRYADMQNTAMCWGFECGNGWYDIIYSASKKIETIIKNLPEKRSIMKASQVKEKWGGLRIYMTYHHSKIESIIRRAEEQSYHTCEVCGKRGKLMVSRGWYNVVCKKHGKDCISVKEYRKFQDEMWEKYRKEQAEKKESNENSNSL